MDAAVLAARVLLAAVFAVAGATKLRDRDGTASALAEFGLPRGATRPVASVLPIVELAVAIALLFDPVAREAGVVAALLLAAFTAGIANALRQGRAPDCGCFGNLSTRPVSGWTVARNVALLAVALFVALSSNADMSAPLAIVAALGVAALVVAAVRSGSTASVGGMAVVDASTPAALELGAPAPEFELRSAAGGRESLGSLRERGAPVVLIFLDAGCGSCLELYPHLGRWQRALAAQLVVEVVMRGDAAAAQVLTEQHAVREVLIDDEPERVSVGFGITSAPAAIVVGDDGRIASRPVTGPLEVEELVRQTLHRAEDAETWKQPSPIA